MAIAGLRNVSVLDSSVRRESQSQTSMQHGDERSPSTQASSLLQMWRELEDEHAVSRAQDGYDEMLHQQRNVLLDASLSSAGAPQNHDTGQMGVSEGPCVGQNVNGLESRDLSGTDPAHEDRNSSIVGRSGDLGEVERERVREIFQEWMNSSRRERASNVSNMNNNSRAGWLGETDQERVRIIRELVQMPSEQRETCREGREVQGNENCIQNRRVHDGLTVEQAGNRIEHIRRGNRKLCGRQALLDMVSRAERERRMELQGLMMLQAVSEFAHRNRIQSLLRGRFLRNDRIVEDKRPSAMAASELGLLRQRHTVSGLRDGFISRLDHSVGGQVSSNHSDTLSNSDSIGNINDQTEENNSHEVRDEFHELSDPGNQESDSCGSIGGRSILECNNGEDINWQESDSRTEEWQERDPQHGDRDWLPSASIEFIERSNITGQNLDENWQEESSVAWSEDTLQNQDGEHTHLQEASEVLSEQPEPIDWLPSPRVEFVEINDVTRRQIHPREVSRVHHEQSEPISNHHSVNDHADNLEVNSIEDMNWQEVAAQGEHQEEEEEAVENEETDWHRENVEYNEWRNGVGGDMDVNQQERTGNEWSQELSASEDREEVYMQEAPEVWQEEGSFQEAVQNWLERPSSQLVSPRVDTFYFPDDDNANSTELRELLSRRRVSSLLHSGFRASLDHLIQSYVERQGRASIDWEAHETSPTPSGERDLGQQSQDHAGEEGVAAGNSSPAPPSLPAPMLPVQSLWDHDSHNDNWQRHDMHQHLGIEWDIINNMRIDMARLHQRMNNMQGMLEACMDMQLELQRSIRQEVSAALNRCSSSSGVCMDNFPEDGSKWDYVRKGICCMCCESNIDSLLYRCGHMCTCSKCANGLVESGEKCPMCLAPVVEVIRAYSIS